MAGTVVFLLTVVLAPPHGPDPLPFAAGLIPIAFGPFLVLKWWQEEAFRLYESGLELPERWDRFWSYADVKKVGLGGRPGYWPESIHLIRRDGMSLVVGGPFTTGADFVAKEFNKVSALMLEGIRKRGSLSQAERTR